MIEIRQRYTDALLLRVEADTLRGARLGDAVLWSADLRGADLTGADLRGANLQGADLRSAVLSGADFTDARVHGATYDEKTLWPDGFDPEAAGAEKQSAPFRGNVLIVEDDPQIRALLVDIVRGEGFRVAVTRNGREALSYLRSNSPPGLILLDLMMPGMNGWSFRVEQLEDPRLAAVPVILFSGLEEAQEQAKKLNVAACFTKPVHAKRLIAAIREHCR